MKIYAVRFFEICLLAAIFAFCGSATARSQQDIPAANGDLGTCHADFTVHDGTGKPIYNAQIQVTLHYGFLNMHKTELEVGTNSDGKAHLTGLPTFAKKPLAFEVKSGTVAKELTDDPATNCNATFDVTLAVR
jgi:hypothetical protein